MKTPPAQAHGADGLITLPLAELEALRNAYAANQETIRELVKELKQQHQMVIDDIPGGWDGRWHKECTTCALIARATEGSK